MRLATTWLTLRMGALVLLGVVAGVLCACGGDSAPQVSPTATRGASPSEATATPPAPAPGSTATPSGPGTNPPEAAQFYEDFLAERELVLGGPIEEADVTGDGRPEVLLNAHIQGCVSCHARTLFVMSGREPIFEDGGEGWLKPLEDGSGFEWISPLRLPGEGACCPSWFYVETYRWQGGAFEPSAAVALRHFLEINNMPLTSPLEPSEQLATVALHYALIQRQHYPQAYELLSSRFKTEEPFAAWNAGFATTVSVFVRQIEFDAASGEVTIRIAAEDRLPGGGTGSAVYEGAWSLVEEGGAWKLDSAVIRLVSD